MKKIFIGALVLIIAAVIFVLYSSRTFVDVSPTINQNGGVVFELFDGSTNAPLSNREVTICDNSIEYNRVQSYEEKSEKYYKRFCEGQKVWARVTTDQNGVFTLNVKSIRVEPPTGIVVDAGTGYEIVSISRSDTLTHQYSPAHVRVVKLGESRRVVSNVFYNINTKEAKEIFTNGDPEKTYAFDRIRLVTYRVK